jgi:hypothetical protein
MIETNDPAWNEGFSAGIRGLQSDSGGSAPTCPNPAKTELALSWQSGFVEGRARAEAQARAAAEDTAQGQSGE